MNTLSVLKNFTSFFFCNFWPDPARYDYSQTKGEKNEDEEDGLVDLKLLLVLTYCLLIMMTMMI